MSFFEILQKKIYKKQLEITLKNIFLIKETTEKVITPRVCLLYELIKKESFCFVDFILFLILKNKEPRSHKTTP